ncbi:MAG TPA: alpha/beta fold hydrolase [Gaiellaceae bacterium]|nr:alpha/beta fold hydrolase [Gaiellaceae bacterium]
MSRSNRTKRNLAARMGSWSAAHWKKATFGWLAFVVVAFALGNLVGTKQVDQTAAGPGESGRMQKILDDGFNRPTVENVLIQSRSARVGDPAFAAVIRDVMRRVSSADAVQNVRRGPVSKDGHSALVQFDIPGKRDKAPDKVGPALDSVDAAQGAHPGFVIGEFGLASAMKGTDTAFGNDLGKAGKLSLPITLIILLLAFGALIAAGIPLLLGLTAVFATFGLMSLPSHLVPVAIQAYAMVLLIGLAVGVDYSMFYLKRERQERAAGRSRQAALAAAAATSGRSVLISGGTVIAAMAGMFMTGDQTFGSIAFATILVVAVAVLGSLTVLPAVLSRLGDKVDRFRIPLVGRRRRDPAGEGGIWGAIVDRVLRRPALSAALAAGLLVALAAPALQLHLAPTGTESFPQSLPVVKNYNRMQQAFPGKALPAEVVVKAPDVTTPAVHTAIAQLERRAVASGHAFNPITVDVNKTHTVADITVPIAGNGTDAASKAAFHALRETFVPQTVGALPHTEAGVTGQTASWQDSADKLRSDLVPVVAFVLLLAFALMLVAFRSIVIAIKAIVLNLLSVGAAYGVLVLVFQHGVGKGLIGASSANGIEVVVPLLLFVILFGLSMDYHVFIISRIRETFDRGATVDDAVSHGIKSTAGVVTSAAIVMVCVFSIFATLSTPFFKQFGVGLAAAILIDATIVRAVLLPASMKLLGRWNWYLPRWLEWLPRLESGELELDGEPEPVPAPTPPAGRRRRLGRARVTGLLVIALAALALGYVKLASGETKVSVPAGAKAGQLTLHSCAYSTEQGSYAADCGTLVVPENRAKPGSRLIGVRVIRIKARSAHPAAPVFRLQGGPGVTNMSFPDASRFAQNHDVVLVGYRGIDSSTRLDCPEVSSALERSTNFISQKSYDAYAQAFRDCATRLQEDGVDLAGYTLPEQVDDLEAARRALGYGRVNLVGESVGTRLAMIYAWRYPRSMNRSILIGVNPPGHFIWDGKATDQLIGRYSRLCAQDASCSRRTDDLAASMRKTASNMPRRFWGLPISAGDAKLGSFFGLMESTSESEPLSAPETIGAWISAAHGDPSGLWFESFAARMLFPQSFVWGETAAVSRADTWASDRYFAQGPQRTDSILGNAGTEFIFGGGALMHAFPPAPDSNEYSRVRDSSVPTLIVNGTLDFATPATFGTHELLPHLQQGREVLLPRIGHSSTFWSYEPKASTRLLNAYFDTGKVDTSLYTPAKVDFTPNVSHTALGKGFAGALYGAPLVVLLSLLLVWRRARKRGRIGRNASVVLRSLLALVLGLGGWFAGILVQAFAFPAIPLDDVRLAVISIGAPVGLGIFLAWLDRDLAGRARTIGFGTSVGAALAGAWLGYQAADGMLAVATTTVGAAAAANLGILVLDILRDRRAPERSVDMLGAVDRLTPTPS